MQETRVRSLGWEDPLEEEMATHSSNLAWKITWTEEPGELQSLGLQRVGHNLVTKQQIHDLLVFKYRFIFKNESMQLEPGKFRDQAEGGCLYCLGGAGPVDHGVVGSDVPFRLSFRSVEKCVA